MHINVSTGLQSRPTVAAIRLFSLYGTFISTFIPSHSSPAVLNAELEPKAKYKSIQSKKYKVVGLPDKVVWCKVGYWKVQTSTHARTHSRQLLGSLRAPTALNKTLPDGLIRESPLDCIKTLKVIKRLVFSDRMISRSCFCLPS